MKNTFFDMKVKDDYFISKNESFVKYFLLLQFIAEAMYVFNNT